MYVGTVQSLSNILTVLYQIDHGSFESFKQHQKMSKKFADCVLKEYENATATESHGSQWMKQLLLPHLEKCYQVSKYILDNN